MILARIFSQIYKEGGIILVDSNGQKYICGNPKKENPVTLKLLKENLNWKLLFDPELEFPEAYMRNEVVIENATMKEFLMDLVKNLGRGEITTASGIIKRIYQAFRTVTNFNLIGKSKKNVEHHYDIGGSRGEKLYDLFLDKKRQYSCAYFKDDNDTLEVAQNNKIDHIIKKLDIRDNQTVLDIGSGWGGMAIEIAKKTKARVLGITLSENQLKYSRQKAKEMNLENQVEFKLIDYRELKSKFDRIVSVGMFEHVGKKFYRKYFKCVHDLLNENGAALIHTIGSIDRPRDPQPWISKYIFPGGYTPSLSEIARPIEESNLVINDLEVLRLHYAHTLRNWRERFLNKKDKVLEMFDERFLRMWEFYLAGCEMAFKWGDQVVFQLQLSKNKTTIPPTRDYIYQ